jgi:hypothetical protein
MLAVIGAGDFKIQEFLQAPGEEVLQGPAVFEKAGRGIQDGRVVVNGRFDLVGGIVAEGGVNARGHLIRHFGVDDYPPGVPVFK